MGAFVHPASLDHRRRRDRRNCRPVDLVSGTATAPAGAGRGGRHAVRHCGARRWAGQRGPGRARAGRRGRGGAGQDRYARDHRKERAVGRR